MLLDILVDSEITKYQENRDVDHLKNIERYVEILNEHNFTERFIRSLGFSSSGAEQLIQQLKLEDQIEEKIHLTCNMTEEDSVISINTTKCPLCKEQISEKEHEFEPLYQVNLQKEEYNGIRQAVSNKLLNVFLDSDYSDNYRSLCNNISSTIPLVGAGFSMPLGAPSWEKLFLEFGLLISEKFRDTYEAMIKPGNYFSGIPLLYQLSKSVREDRQLKPIAAEIIERHINYDIPNEKHNYVDLLKVKFPYYLTTNYDNALNIFSSKYSVPLEIEEIENVQKFISEHKSRVVHLHGILDKPNSLVLTKDDYTRKYQDDTYTKKALALMAHKSLLFLGFSFSDEHFTELYKYVREIVGGRHYIITTDASKADELIQLNIIPIVLKVNNRDETVIALKYLLKNIEMINHV
ncbi:SIR2 family protein [Paenibacillus sp. UMB7766-LJ446]|uniref:SIR2 family protein n=1 Tax=Paenibacillus sp. UMB7766-LJ446 TaxID=3046313 RepID=UPI00254BB37F|nr:SIR2 family protein [Paenibacillus sp. UMB7766-LJ446]MDK8193479.1 SIR2 family protein [Paenibacillus sp. UMB7766-LJ446]